jgi:hypothetical protein
MGPVPWHGSSASRVGEGDIGVVDALVVVPPLLALLERHVAAVTLPPRRNDDARRLRQVIVRLGRRRKLAQELRRWR